MLRCRSCRSSRYGVAASMYIHPWYDSVCVGCSSMEYLLMSVRGGMFLSSSIVAGGPVASASLYGGLEILSEVCMMFV